MFSVITMVPVIVTIINDHMETRLYGRWDHSDRRTHMIAVIVTIVAIAVLLFPYDRWDRYDRYDHCSHCTGGFH